MDSKKVLAGVVPFRRFCIVCDKGFLVPTLRSRKLICSLPCAISAAKE